MHLSRGILTSVATVGTFLAATLAGTVAGMAAPNVVASIKPVHSLVAAIMDGVGEPDLLIEAGQSPHTYAMRPSDAAALERADLVVWIGPDLETFLGQPLASLTDGESDLMLQTLPDLIVRAPREGGEFAAHGHEHGADDDHEDHAEHDEHEAEHAGHDAEHEADEDAHADHEHEEDDHDMHDADDGHGHDHGEASLDAHVWLDPVNAQVMTTAIAERLAGVDPDNAEAYRENAAAMAAHLDDLIARTEERVAPLGDTAFIVFHDAYQYFEARFGLPAAGSIVVSPELPPSAARIADIRARMAELDAVCIFSEPEFRPDIVDSIVESTGARTGVLDLLGVDIPAGPDHYIGTIEALTDEFVACLGG